MWKAVATAGAALAILAPAAHAQEQDVVRGTATVVDGSDVITYEIEAVAGPLGENATGLIVRNATGLGGNSLVVADVTCVAVQDNLATIIARVRPLESVNVGYQALLVRVFDGTPQLQPDGVGSATDPRSGSAITFTDCAGFLNPFPTMPVTAGDLQVFDGSPEEPPPPPPPPPPGCEEDDDHGDEDDDGDRDEDDCDDGEDDDEDD